MKKLPRFIFFITLLAYVLTPYLIAVEYHVAKTGSDSNSGTSGQPFLTIQHAADIAQPGDIVTVHEGVYRERVNPPRGGTSESNRIVYQAAANENVVIKGSEEVSGWTHLSNDTWELALPNSFFGSFNPFNNLIWGDWFSDKGRDHHTAAVYLNEHWLAEAATESEVMQPYGSALAAADPSLVNIAWFEVSPFAAGSSRIDMVTYDAKTSGPCSATVNGVSTIGCTKNGDWFRFNNVDFGTDADEVELKVSSGEGGGVLEMRLGSPTGTLLGSLEVFNTGAWTTWRHMVMEITPTSGSQTVYLVTKWHEADPLWHATVNASNTVIKAQFPGVNPNNELTEVNARQTIFYPEITGRNYITVRGFKMLHAATPWAPPTAEQIGAIGTNWSKGWIIEDNEVGYSVCTGVTLGKYGDIYDNTSADSADGYVATIDRALQNGWSKANIGSHYVLNNKIYHCEQAGLVGSMGAAFSTISGNTIHDIHVRKLFGGAEMAGVKIHAPIDCNISGNIIYRTTLGLWLDWMTQGTRVSQNLMFQNSRDIYVEVNHGPFLVDNNLLMSPASMRSISRGSAYVHNIMAGTILVEHNDDRQTPFHIPHSTAMVGLNGQPSGDERFYNNIIIGNSNGNGLAGYNAAALPLAMNGNVYLNAAQDSTHDANSFSSTFDPEFAVIKRADGFEFKMKYDSSWSGLNRSTVTTALLGTAVIPNAPFENPDGSPYIIDTDFLAQSRDANPAAGAFAFTGTSELRESIQPQAASVTTSTAPVVSFELPPHNVTISIGDDLEVRVNALDADGIDHVRLYMNGVELSHLDSSAPYEWGASFADAELTNMQEGVYVLSAVAKDNSGENGEASVTVVVGNPFSLPMVSFNTPSTDVVLNEGDNLSVNVGASDPDGISRVRLYLDGVELNRSEGSAPYTWGPNQGDTELQNFAMGIYLLTARAIDHIGNVGENSITVTVQGPSTELLTNSSLEMGFEHGWTISSPSEVAVSTELASDGNYSFKFVAEADGYIPPLRQTVTVDPNTNYILSYDVFRVASTQGGFTVRVTPGPLVSQVYYNAMSSWESIQLEFNSGTNTDIEIQVYADGGFSDTVYIDNFKLEMQTATPAEQWMQEKGVTDIMADDDNDGISNLLEFALGSEPLTQSATDLPIINRTATTVDISFLRAEDSITYKIEKSTDLSTWTEYTTVNNSHGTVGSTATVSVPNTEMSHGKLFLRLTVEE